MSIRTPLIFCVLAVEAGAQPATSPRPELAISINGSAASTVIAGWPLLVRGTVMHSGHLNRAAVVPPLVLAPAGLAWPDAIEFQVLAANGSEQNWMLTLVRPPEQPGLTLPHRQWTEVLWQMSPEASSQIQAGVYRLTARLTIRDSQGWNGTVQSKPATIQIVTEAEPSPEQTTRRALAFSQYAAYNGEMGSGQAALDEALKAEPRSVPLLAAKARLFEAAGDFLMAYLSAARALRIHLEADPQPRESAREIMYLRNRLLGKLLDQPPVVPNP
ncbi:MAG: hypothetical protein HYR60_25225 [Acidobacteria bacterium]|nr:hypothetical protein [Acidobacteriota bacterium]